MNVSTILDQIDDGGIALPEFQRGYVWNRDQVRGLMDSLYRKHPVGSLLVWTTRTENADARGPGKLLVNSLANFTFLTQDTNIRVSDRDPAVYLEEFVARNPGAVESHWIPMDRELWKIENYPAFLDARRELLAAAANDFLESLSGGTAEGPDVDEGSSIVDREAMVVPGGVEDDDEMQLLIEVNDWVVEQGLPDGELEYELVDDESGEPLAVLDLAWPDGLQEGLSQPVVLLIGETQATEEAANQAGYRFFTDVESFREYVRDEVLALEPALTEA
jgi:hypothetical protein